MSSKKRRTSEEVEQPIVNSTPPYVNPSTREFPKRPSPLANVGVAPGHFYDMNTGLVKPYPVTPTPEPEE